jgi:hypothetical protein
VGLVLDFEHTRLVWVLGQRTENAYQGYQYSQKNCVQWYEYQGIKKLLSERY